MSPIVQGSNVRIILNGIEIGTVVSATVVNAMTNAWHPRAYPYRLRKEQFKRQVRINYLSCLNQIRRLEEKQRRCTNPVQWSLVGMSIDMLHAMKVPTLVWKDEDSDDPASKLWLPPGL